MQFPSGFYFDIQIENYKGFLTYHDLLHFEMIETSGLEVPTVELLFVTNSVKVKDMVKEANTFKVLMGENNADYDTFDVQILERDVKDHQIGSYSCYVKGFTGDKRFLTDKVQTSINSDPIEGMAKICNTYAATYGTPLSLDLNIESNISIQNQKMNWIAMDESYRQLLVDMWLHLDLSPSFPLAAISRYNTVILKDFNTIISNKIDWNFSQTPVPIQNTINTLFFTNPFMVDNYTETYDIYAGYGKVVNIRDIETGDYKVHVHEPTNLLGASSVLDISKGGSRTLNGFKKSSNVTPNYYYTYMYNAAKLLAMSNICGYSDFPNVYNRNLNLLDLVNVILPDTEQGKALSGKYLVHTIVYSFSATTQFVTRAYISRDCNNHVENNIVKVNTGIKIPASTQENMLQNIKLTRALLAGTRSYVDGTLFEQTLYYFSNLKTNLLRSFSIAGTTIDLNSQTTIMSSFSNLGRSIFFKLLSQYVPSNVQYLFQSQDWGKNINLVNLLNSTIAQYAPPEIAGLYSDLLLTLNDINYNLQGLQESAIAASGVGTVMLLSSSSVNSAKINNITNSMLNNVQALNIPIPVMNLTQSQQLLNNNDLRNLIATNIIDSLQMKGYLKDFDTDPSSISKLSLNYFKKILLGNVIIDDAIIDKIATNANGISSLLHTRYWGTFSNANYTPNLMIPVMTSDSAPYGIVSSSSNNGTAYRAFDRTQNAWLADGPSGWISYKFSNKTVIDGYAITGNFKGLYYDIDSVLDIIDIGDIDTLESQVQTSPRDWTFEGSNDGINWVILDTQINIKENMWKSGADNYFTVSNFKPYLNYRLNISANNGNSILSICEFKMYNLTPSGINDLTDYTIRKGSQDYFRMFTNTLPNSSIPLMTSNDAPHGKAIASSNSNDAFYAFDGTYNNWISNEVNGWVGYKFPTSTVIGGYKITGNENIYRDIDHVDNLVDIDSLETLIAANPRNWTFEGSNDGFNWVILDTRSNVTEWEGKDKYFTIPNRVNYLYYRLNVSNSNGSDVTSIKELKMYPPLNTTKVISATGGSGIYMVIPTSYDHLVFIINNNVVNMESIPIDLRIFDKYGNKVPYTLYYTPSSLGFNSSNVELTVITTDIPLVT